MHHDAVQEVEDGHFQVDEVLLAQHHRELLHIRQKFEEERDQLDALGVGGLLHGVLGHWSVPPVL